MLFRSFPGTKAEVAAKIGVYLLDEGKDSFAGRDEVESLARDVEAQGTPPPPPPPPPADEEIPAADCV